MGKTVVKRQKYYAFVATDSTRYTSYSVHFSKEGAEKHYGNLRRLWRGNSSTDYYLNVYSAEEWDWMIEKGEIRVDEKEKTVFLK